MKRTLALVLIASFTVGASPSISNAVVKVGAACKKEGRVSTNLGKKYTCIKKSKKLVWNNTSADKRAKPIASSKPTLPPSPSSFEAWSINIDSKMLSNQAQQNFLIWVKNRMGKSINHTQLVEPNPHANRISILKKADDLSAQLFSSYFSQGSTTVIGATESWTVDQLTKTGWPTTSCDFSGPQGVAYCLDNKMHNGYVVTGDASYQVSNPGNDGGALLAHEYFHLVQWTLAKESDPIGLAKNTSPESINAVPIWFIEGGADFVGFSVGALSQAATYWDGRATMFLYSPPEESINKNPIVDYEVRTCCGNNTPTYPYHIGRVATEFIVASIGFQKLLDILIDYATTRNFEKSFESVTGISKSTFYEKFELVRTKVGLPPISWKLDGLTNKKIGS